MADFDAIAGGESASPSVASGPFRDYSGAYRDLECAMIPSILPDTQAVFIAALGSMESREGGGFFKPSRRTRMAVENVEPRTSPPAALERRPSTRPEMSRAIRRGSTLKDLDRAVSVGQLLQLGGARPTSAPMAESPHSRRLSTGSRRMSHKSFSKVGNNWSEMRPAPEPPPAPDLRSRKSEPPPMVRQESAHLWDRQEGAVGLARMARSLRNLPLPRPTSVPDRPGAATAEGEGTTEGGLSSGAVAEGPAAAAAEGAAGEEEGAAGGQSAEDKYPFLLDRLMDRLAERGLGLDAVSREQAGQARRTAPPQTPLQTLPQAPLLRAGPGVAGRARGPRDQPA